MRVMGNIFALLRLFFLHASAFVGRVDNLSLNQNVNTINYRMSTTAKLAGRKQMQSCSNFIISMGLINRNQTSNDNYLKNIETF